MKTLVAGVVTVALVAAGCGDRKALKPPGCTQKTARTPYLPDVRSRSLRLTASPFGVVSVGGFSFVTVGGYTGLNELQVYRDSGLHPRLVRSIALPIPGAAGETLTRDGRELFVAAGSGVTVVDVHRAEHNSGSAVLGSLQAAQAPARTNALDLESAIEVAVTPDSDFAFVSLEYAGRIAVFDLRAARAAGWKRSGFRGMITTGLVNVGLAISADGGTLYATRAVNRAGEKAAQTGTLDVIDVKRAETTPRTAVTARVSAGCDPVRVAVTGDGQTVWVTARASNTLLGFSALKLAWGSQELEAIRVDQRP